jgi:hypothetical protein
VRQRKTEVAKRVNDFASLIGCFFCKIYDLNGQRQSKSEVHAFVRWWWLEKECELWATCQLAFAVMQQSC